MPFDIAVELRNYRGRVNRVSQSAILTDGTQRGVQEADRPGICWEICRRWVRRRLTLADNWNTTVVYDVFPSTPEDLREVIAAHAARNRSGIPANYEIVGLQIAGQRTRTYNCLNIAKGLDSRAAVAAAIFKPGGVYIFGFSKDGGHAVAFDTRGNGGELLFMDPNTGEMIVPSNRVDNFKTFFKNYWGHYYKTLYTRGDRELTQYEVATRTFLEI